MNKRIWIPKFNYYSKRLSMWQEKLWNEVNSRPFMGILDNVAGRKTFEYATFGKSGIQQSNSKLLGIQVQKMTAACVWNASNAISVADSGLTTQIDRGSATYDVTPDPTDPQDCDAFGYSVTGEDYLGLGTFGTIDDDTYNDGGATSRTIKAVYYTQPCLGNSEDDNFYFSLDGTSISNSDTTWQDIDWDDTAGTPRTIDRSVNTTYTASLNGSTHWRWLNATYSWADLDINTDFVLTTS